MDKVKLYFISLGYGIANFLRGLDILVNSILGGDGRETISSRLGKYRHGHPGVEFVAKIVDKIFFWEKNHTNTHENPTVGDKQTWN